MSLKNKLSQLAKSQQGKDLVEKAKTIANDPKTREKIDGARGKLSGHVETAKQKMAEKKSKDGGARAGNGATDPLYGDEGAPGKPPAYGEETAAEPTATYGDGSAASTTPAYGEESPGGTPPTAPHEEPIDTTNPAYGEEEGDKPLYGEDGPKAA